MQMYSTALEMHVAVAILRVQEGLDYSDIIADFDFENQQQQPDTAGIDNPTFVKDESAKLPPLAPFSNASFYKLI